VSRFVVLAILVAMLPCNAVRAQESRTSVALTVGPSFVNFEAFGGNFGAFVGGLGSTNTAALKGCWCFDCLYGGGDPDFWFKRGANAAPFYAYYYDTAANAKALLKLMGHERDKEFSEGGPLNVINNSTKNHYRTASEGFAERLKAVKL